jgi:6-phosphogluconolactonase
MTHHDEFTLRDGPMESDRGTFTIAMGHKRTSFSGHELSRPSRRKRMKLNKLSQLFLVSAIGLILASFLTACQLVTIDFVFVAASAGNSAGSNGQIYTYATDSESGALRSAYNPMSSGGTIPVALAVTSDYFNLYVANAGNKSVVHFSIDDHGVLTQKDTITLANTPVSIAVSPANNYLYVVSGTSSATLSEYALSSGTIGSATATLSLTVPGYGSDMIVPTAVNVLANSNTVYATVYDKSAYNPGGTTTSNANPGWVFAYSIGSGGALTAVSASPFQAGVKPSAIASDPTSRFVYVTDFASNELIGYGVQSSGSLLFLINGPFKTGNQPTAITIDPRGLYLRRQLSGFERLRLQHRAAYRHSIDRGQRHLHRRQHHRHRSGVHRSRAVAGTVRLHGQLSGQLRLRVPPESQHRSVEHHSGHTLSHRRRSRGDRCRSARQPRH